MLRFAFIITIWCCAFSIKAQSRKDSLAKSEFNIYKYKPTPKDRVVFEVSHTGWLGAPNDLHETYTSGGVNIHFFFDHPLAKALISLVPGVEDLVLLGKAFHHHREKNQKEIPPIQKKKNLLKVRRLYI